MLVTTTPLAVLGPRFETVTEKVALCPTATRDEALIMRSDRSAIPERTVTAAERLLAV